MKKKYLKKIMISQILLLFFGLNSLVAQIQNNGSLYVAEEGIMYIAESNFGFGASPALTETSTAETGYGVLAFSEGASWSSASENHFVNGYIRYYGSTAFTAPIGNDNIYAPLVITPSDNSGVDAAYFYINPTSLGASLGTDIIAVSSEEYWKVTGTTSSVISLTWRESSNIGDLLSSSLLSYLTIVGYNGAEWVEIPSAYDETSVLGNASTTTEGSITSLNAIDLTSYQYFAIAVKDSCFPLVSSSENVKTWNGTTWSPSEPQLEDPVVINQPYSGNLTCYSVELNADITLANGETLEVVEGFTGSGKVIMSSEASLLQRNSGAAPPKIEMTKVTNPMRRFDYVFLSSPLDDFSTFYNNITSPQNTAVNGEFSTYTASAFYNLFTDNDSGGSVVVTSSNVPVGRGFAATVSPSQAPYTVSAEAGSWYEEKYPVYIKAEGNANNGAITVPVPSSSGWVRIGNPYPSPINAERLLDEMGDNFRKTIYFWSYTTPRQNWQSTGGNYNSADYAIYNYTGGVAACNGCQVPTGNIATMQSVYVKKLNPSSISFSLTNCLRELNGNDNFFRTQESEEGKYWLNLQDTKGDFSQILVGYNINGSLEYENGYDSTRMPGTVGTSEVNTLIENQNSGYAIQTRADFNINDIVPVQVIQRTDEMLTIYLYDKTGVFDENEMIKIYLHDKLLDVYHNLSDDGGYSFIQPSGTDNARFEIVYMEEALSSDKFNSDRTMAYTYNKIFNAKSQINMSNIEVYDLSGRLIEKYTNINEPSLNKPFNHSQAIYLAKIQLENGNIIYKKVINN